MYKFLILIFIGLYSCQSKDKSNESADNERNIYFYDDSVLVGVNLFSYDSFLVVQQSLLNNNLEVLTLNFSKDDLKSSNLDTIYYFLARSNIKYLHLSYRNFFIPKIMERQKSINHLDIWTDTLLVEASDFSFFDSLEKLSISIFKSNFPENLHFNTTKIKEISLQGEFYTIPKFIFLLPNVESITLKSKNLSFLPQEIKHLKSLRYLNIVYTDIGKSLSKGDSIVHRKFNELALDSVMVVYSEMTDK